MSTDHLALAERFVSAIQNADIPTIRACYAPDARIWHNFDGIEQTVDENLVILGWLVKQMPERKYQVSRRENLPDGFMQQHVLAGKSRLGEAIAMPACIICKVQDGKITRLDDYLDPAAAAALQKR